MPQDNNDITSNLDDLTASLKASLDAQADIIKGAAENVAEGISSDNDKFTNKLDVIKGNLIDAISNATQGGKLTGLKIDDKIGVDKILGNTDQMDAANLVLGFKFLKVKSNILNAIDAATQGGKLTGLDIEKKIDLSKILGESPKLNIIHALRWLKIKKTILQKIQGSLEAINLEIDPKMKLGDILGSTPDQDMITRARFFMIRQGLVSKIAKAAKDFDPTSAVNDMAGYGGGEGAAGGGSGGGGGGGDSESLSSMMDNTERTANVLTQMQADAAGNSLQEKENRREAKAAAKAAGSKKGDDAGSKDSGGGGGGGILGMLGKGAGKAIEGFLKGLGKGLDAIADKKYLLSAGVLVALGGALIVTGIGLKQFVGIDYKQVLFGIGVLGVLAVGAKLIGDSATSMIKGALAIALLGAALIPAGFAFGMFSDINWASVGIGIGVLVALGVAAFGLSFIAPQLFIGALAIAALGAAMIPAAFAFNLFGKALGAMAPLFEAIASAITGFGTVVKAFGMAISTIIGAVGDFLITMVDSLIRLGDPMIGLGLAASATGIGLVSAALIAFGASSAIGGLLSFFGGNPIEKFLELSDKSAGLKAAADSIDAIAAALEKMDGDKVEDMADSLKPMVKQLDKLSELDLSGAAKFFKSFVLGGSTPAPVATAGDVGAASAAALETKPVKKSKEGKASDAEEAYGEALQAQIKTESALKAFEGGLIEGKDYRIIQIGDDDAPNGPSFKTEYTDPETEKKLKQLESAKRRAMNNSSEKEKDMLIDSGALRARSRNTKNAQTMNFARKRFLGMKGVKADSFNHRKNAGWIQQLVLSKMAPEEEAPSASPKSKGGLFQNFKEMITARLTGAELESSQRENDIQKEALKNKPAPAPVVNNVDNKSSNTTTNVTNQNSHMDKTATIGYGPMIQDW